MERPDDRIVAGRFRVVPCRAQALLTGPAVARLGERWALVVGMGFKLTALLILGFATQGWILFALAPLFALGGIGMPALQSLTTQQVDADNQGNWRASSRASSASSAVFGPMFFSTIYFGLKTRWPGAIWVIGAAVYLLALRLHARHPAPPARRPPRRWPGGPGKAGRAGLADRQVDRRRGEAEHDAEVPHEA